MRSSSTRARRCVMRVTRRRLGSFSGSIASACSISFENSSRSCLLFDDASGQCHIGAWRQATLDFDGTCEVPSRPFFRPSQCLSLALDRDHQLGDGAIAPGFVERHRPLGQRPNDRPVDQQLGMVEAAGRDSRPQRCGRPVQQLHMVPSGPRQRLNGVGFQSLADAAKPCLEASPAVVLAALGECKGPLGQAFGTIVIVALQGLRLCSHEPERVLRVEAAGGRQQWLIVWDRCQQRFVEHQGKGHGAGDEIGIVMRGNRIAALRQRIRNPLYGQTVHGATAGQAPRHGDDGRFARKPGNKGVNGHTSPHTRDAKFEPRIGSSGRPGMSLPAVPGSGCWVLGSGSGFGVLGSSA